MKALDQIDARIERDIFGKGTIQTEMGEIEDFPELLDDICQKVSALQQADANELAKILKTLMDIYSTLGSCVNNIGLTQDLIRQLRTHFSDEKQGKSDA